MKDRIFALIQTLGKGALEFANTIDISPAVLSSIKSERTKPTVFLIEKIKTVYPNVDMNWLITGEGSMFIDNAQDSSTSQVNSVIDGDVNNKEYTVTDEKKDAGVAMAAEPEVCMKVETHENCRISTDNEAANVKENASAGSQAEGNDKWFVKAMVSPDPKSITQILVLYNDGTFETLRK